jgi:hypothetical protein
MAYEFRDGLMQEMRRWRPHSLQLFIVVILKGQNMSKPLTLTIQNGIRMHPSDFAQKSLCKLLKSVFARLPFCTVPVPEHSPGFSDEATMSRRFFLQ